MAIKLRSKKNIKGIESLYLDIYHKGVRRYEFLDIKIKPNDPNKKALKELAEKIRAKKELETHANAYQIPNVYSSEEDFLSFYLSKAKDQSFKSSYHKIEEFSKNKLIKGILPFKCVDEKFCEQYKEWLLQKISNNTTWVYIYKLKAVLNKAIKEKIINTNPAKYISIKNQEAEKIYLTFEELKKLSSTDIENKELKRAFLFACYTGLRLSDVKNLTWDQIRERKLFFRQQKTRGFEYLPLGDSTIKLLYSNNPDNVIPLPEMKVFEIKIKQSKTIGQTLTKWAQKAEINKKITFHTARHTFATLSLTSGVDLYTVSKLLGHKSINTTQIYGKIIDEKMNKAVNMLPSL